MSKKYVVQSCPSLDTDGMTCQDCSFDDCGMEDCVNRTDCLIKQVIEKCKEHVDSLCPCPDEGKSCIECTIAEEEYIACQLIQLFEIEECNDEV